jgi:Transposase DDE domain
MPRCRRQSRFREFLIDTEGRDGRPEKAVVISTIIDPSIPQEELSDLYWRRWACELDMRAIKQSMQLDVLRCKNPEMVSKEIFAHLLAYNLLRGVMTESAKRTGATPRQLSVKGAMQAVESFTPAMMAANGNEALYAAFLTTVAAHRVGNRPGRQEPRKRKRRHAWRDYLMVPRNKCHRRLTSEARH